MHFSLKVLRKLACANEDVFLANFSCNEIVIAKKIVKVSEAIAVIEAEGNTACFLPYADVASYDLTLNAIPAQVKLGGIFNCPSSFVLKINKEKITPNFAFIVLKFAAKASPFVGIAITYHAETDARRAKLGTYFLETEADYSAALSTAERLCQQGPKSAETSSDSDDDEAEDDGMIIKIDC